MRRLIAGVSAAALLLSHAAMAQRECPTIADQQVFEVAALKSEMMVLATSCHDDTQYNAFIHRFQSALLDNDHAFDAYFKRAYGRAGQVQHDAYITALANGQSDVGLQLGTDFCDRDQVLFSEVMAVPSAGDLPEYAAGKELIPASLGACEPAPPATKAAVRHIVAKKK